MRALIIDDETAIASALQQALAYEGITSDIAHDGEEGLAKARQGGWDVIVLDILMPKMNGFKVCQTLRDEGNTTPIIVVSAKDGEFDQADMLDAGADDYVIKPYNIVVLVARLRALTRRGLPGESEPSIGPMKLHRGSQQLAYNDERIDLTQREYDLMDRLMRAGGNIVSKQQLLADLWGDADADPNIVEVYVGYLRKKIDVPRNTSHIQTVRRAGYRIHA